MTTISGSEVARLVLRYLQCQQMDKVALDFCKLSPYLREEYGILKRGLKIKELNKYSLINVVKDFIEYEEIVTERFQNLLNHYEQIPIDLLRARTLKDKLLYLLGRISENDGQSSQSMGVTLAKKRSNVSIMQTDYDSDSTDMSTPRATNEQDLPGYSGASRPPRPKRRKLYDPTLLYMINDKNDVTNTDGNKPEQLKSTPSKPSGSLQDPTSTKKRIPGETLSETLLSYMSPGRIAQQINNGFGEEVISLDQLPDKMVNIMTTFEDMVDLRINENDNSSSCGSKAVSDAEFDNNRQLETPLPTDPANGCRYDLRSNRKSTSNLASAESKRKRNSKIQILSDEQINPPGSGSEIVIVSDEEPVSTTSQSQQVQQTQFQAVGMTVLYNGVPFIPVYDPESNSVKLTPISQDRSNFVNEPIHPCTTSIPNQIIGNVIDSSGYMIATDQSNNQFINFVDNSAIIGSNILSNRFITETTSNQMDATNNSAENRMIVVVTDDVNQEGTQPIQVNQQSTCEIPKEVLKEQSHETNANQMKDKPNPMAQFKVISGQKVVTPKQLIRPNIPSSSRSLSTPRDKIKKVLDFNTPNRFRLDEIMEGKNETGLNTSRFFSETPHNRTITSSVSRSAPPKVDSAVQSRRASIEKSLESNDAFVPAEENTVISVEGETPKVRKNNRRSCVRTISTHKEINAEENEKRLNRVAVTKKKICADDVDSNESEKNDEINAAEEWNRQKEARNLPIDQIVREQNSKKEENKMPTGRKRSRRSKKKPPPKKNTNPAKAVIEKLTKSFDVSLNSSLDISMNSTIQNEAKMLEENLKSAKKLTPIKQTIHKSAKKKTPIGKKLQIKLPTKSPKYKALKKIKSAKNLVTEKTNNDNAKADNVTNNAVLKTEIDTKSATMANKMEIEPQSNDQAQIYVSENTTDDLEVAQNLISMQEVILLQESEKKKAQKPSTPEVQSDSVSMSASQPVVEVAVCKTMSQPLPVEKISSTLLKNIAQPNLSLSALLETPYKDNGLAFPRTPGLNSILPQLTTPMILRPCESLMDDSIFKNPQFPTPNFPITPGSIFTPFKDMLSPHGEEVVYGAPNRPTDYSSSSSYYKPDESDGIDKQIQASVRSAQTNSGVYSADEIDDSSKIDDTTQNTTQNTSRSSSSSSSSSSDSDSDSDSDSSSSSDSETSQISQKALEPIADAEQNDPTIQPIDVVDEDTTQIIKSHLVNTAEVNIAQNILLSEPEPCQSQAVFDKEAEQIKLLDEKRRRMQDSLRQDEMKNRDKMKPKQTKKYQRNITEAKRERLRITPAIVSPSKRKSSQPMKVVSIQNQQIYSKVVNVVASQTMKLDDVGIKTQCVTTERLISEAAGDNAIVDASDVSTTQNTRKSIEEEESVDAIKSHMTKSRHLTESIPSQKNIAPTQLSPEDLVDMLSEKQKKLNANRPKTKTEVIAPLPLTRATRARTRSQKIRPISAIITKPMEIVTKVTTKPSIPIKEQRRSKDNKDTDKSNQKPKTIVKKSEPLNAEPSNVETVKAAISSEGLVKPECSLETPAKKKIKQQIHDIFGDCTDIETPIKSPPKKITQKKPELAAKCNQPSQPLRKSPRTSPVQQIDKPSTKYEADSSTVQDESDDSDDSDDSNDSEDSESEDDKYELALSIDESDKRRFLSIRENASTVTKVAVTSQTIDIRPWKLNIDGVNVVLAASDIEELYTQDFDSVAEMKRGRRSGKESKADLNNEPTSSSEEIYGRPLHTSTPSPTITITPKFNIKHKTSTTVSPKSAKKQNAGKGENYFNGIKIDDVLFHLHPTNE